ncbi:MAG: hypothetical protein ACYC8T_21730 [Myxococcaceae bacterium]
MLLAALLVTSAAAPVPAEGAAGPVVVLVSRRVELPRAEAEDLAEQVVQALRAGGVEVPLSAGEAAVRLSALGIADSADCAGQAACLTAHAARLGAAVVVALEVGGLMEDLATHLEVFTVASAKRLGAQDYAGPASGARAALAGQAGSLIEPIRAALAPRPADAPRVVELAPAPVVKAPALTAVPSPRWSSPAVLAAGGTALAAGAVAAVFAARGMGAKNAYEAAVDRRGGTAVFEVTRPRAEELRGTANQSFTVSAVAGGTGFALAVLCGYLYAR